MSKVYGVGIVGAGVIFNDHAHSYKTLSNRAQMVGISDVDANKMHNGAGKHFIPVQAEDYKQLLERDDIDIIDVCTPPRYHEQIVIDALKAGKHVLCEKPMAHSLASVDRMIEAAEKSEKKLSIIFQFRYDPEFRRMLYLRDKGKLGKLLLGRVCRYDRLEGSTSFSSGWWGRWDVAGGGALMTKFIHQLDQVLCLFGKPIEVSAVADTLAAPVESEDNLAATIRFENGAIVQCFTTVTSHEAITYMDIVGEKASVHSPWTVRSYNPAMAGKLSAEALEKYPGPKKSRIPKKLGKVQFALGRFIPRLLPKSSQASHVPQIRAFLDALDGKADLPVDMHQGRLSIEVCTAIYTSAITGKRVALPLKKSNRFYEGISAEDYEGRKRKATSND